MVRKRVIVCLLFLVLVTEVRSQFFDFFGIPPLVQNYQTQKPNRNVNIATTKKPKLESVQVSNHRHEQTVKKVSSITYSVEESDENSRQNSREKKRKTQLTLAPIFNFNVVSTTAKAIRKTKGSTTSHKTNSSARGKPKQNNRRIQTSAHDLDNSDSILDARFERPVINNIGDNYYAPVETTHSYDYQNNFHNGYDNYNRFTTKRPVYTTTKRSYNSYTTRNPNSEFNYNSYTTKNVNSENNYNSYTTRNPFYNRPGVKPAVPAIVENRPPITNRPVTNRPFVTNRPTTRVTKRPVIVPARPTDAGAISFPEDDLSPQIIMGPDEDYMSETEKRRYIEMAEQMCDKYKSLNMKQLQAIPLIPSPEPVEINVSSCAPVNIPLVVGGKVVRVEDFPHMALLGWLRLEGPGYSWKCGGSLVSDQFVLTAAHCSYQDRDNTVVSGPPRAAQLGSSYLDDSGALVVRIGAVVRHPKYKFPKSYYDIALLKLTKPVTFSQVIRPACLGVPPAVSEPVIATGWGRTERNEQSLELRSVSLPIWDMDKCAEVLGTSRKLPSGPSSDSQVCAGEMRGGKDTCQGDSGGPAQIQDGCVWRVVAVTSLGRSCGAPNTPGLYAKVPRAFVAATIFGGIQNNNNQQQNNYDQQQNNNNQQHNNYDQPQNNYNQPQNNYNQQQNNHNQQQNNHNQQHNYYDQQQNNNNHRDFRNDDSNYYQTSTNRNYRVDNVYNKPETNQNGRNFNTNDNIYINQHNQGNNNNNQRRDYRDNNQDEYTPFNNHQSNYNVNNNQPNFNSDIDSSRIWFTR